MTTLAVLVLGVTLTLLRQRGVPATNSLFAEDGGHFLGLVVFAATAPHIRRAWLRAVLAAAVFFPPAGDNDLANDLNNLHWYLVFAAFWCLLWRPRTRLTGWVAVGVVFLDVTSDGSALLLAPLARGRFRIVGHGIPVFKSTATFLDAQRYFALPTWFVTALVILAADSLLTYLWQVVWPGRWPLAAGRWSRARAAGILTGLGATAATGLLVVTSLIWSFPATSNDRQDAPPWNVAVAQATRACSAKREGTISLPIAPEVPGRPPAWIVRVSCDGGSLHY